MPLLHAPQFPPILLVSSAPEQVEAILNDVVCSFIDLNNDQNGSIKSTLNLTKKENYSLY